MTHEALTVVTRDQWNARPPKQPNAHLDQRTHVVGHHTTGASLGDVDHRQWVRNIQDFHMDNLGWNDIGYNFLYDAGARIYVGRGWGHRGAHAGGHNSYTHGFAYLGDTRNEYPDGAKIAFLALCDEAEARFGSQVVIKHSDVRNTACPGNMKSTWIDAGMPAPKQPDERRYDMVIYGKRGTPDYGIAAAVHDARPFGVVTSNADEVKGALRRQEKVVVVGGPAADEFPDADVKIVGSNAADTARRLAVYAGNGWA